MSSPGPSAQPSGGPGPELAPVHDDAREETPQWPVTRLAAAGLTLLLVICMAAPAAGTAGHGAQWWLVLLPAGLATVSARVLFEAVAPARRRRLRSHLVPAILAAGIATALLSAAAVIVGLQWSGAVAAATAALAGGALVGAGLVRDLEIRVRLALRRVFFAGSPEARRDLEQELRRRSDASFVGSASVSAPIDAGRLAQAVRDSNATVFVIDRDAMRLPAVVEAASELNLRGLHVRELVGYYEAEFKKVPLAELSPTWFLFDIAQIHRHGLSNHARRGAETLLAGALALLSTPLLLLAALAVRLSGRGPVLYRQRRVGLDGAQFTLLKLRTMTATDGPAAWAPSQTHRVTAVGRLLRRFRLDELPQLWNVVGGDLALIGPRPEQVPIVERLEAEIPFYGARHTIRPGLTGWAQVNLGYGGSVEGTIAKLQRDLYYIKHANLRLDALILWLTIKTIVSGRG
jgi:lipopolysaccharide/colanic/teichoic acid biosynthesis glycosyltransferase